MSQRERIDRGANHPVQQANVSRQRVHAEAPLRSSGRPDAERGTYDNSLPQAAAYLPSSRREDDWSSLDLRLSSLQQRLDMEAVKRHDAIRDIITKHHADMERVGDQIRQLKLENDAFRQQLRLSAQGAQPIPFPDSLPETGPTASAFGGAFAPALGEGNVLQRLAAIDAHILLIERAEPSHRRRLETAVSQYYEQHFSRQLEKVKSVSHDTCRAYFTERGIADLQRDVATLLARSNIGHESLKSTIDASLESVRTEHHVRFNEMDAKLQQCSARLADTIAAARSGVQIESRVQDLQQRVADSSQQSSQAATDSARALDRIALVERLAKETERHLSESDGKIIVNQQTLSNLTSTTQSQLVSLQDNIARLDGDAGATGARLERIEKEFRQFAAKESSAARDFELVLGAKVAQCDVVKKLEDNHLRIAKELATLKDANGRIKEQLSQVSDALVAIPAEVASRSDQSFTELRLSQQRLSESSKGLETTFNKKLNELELKCQQDCFTQLDTVKASVEAALRSSVMQAEQSTKKVVSENILALRTSMDARLTELESSLAHKLESEVEQMSQAAKIAVGNVKAMTEATRRELTGEIETLHSELDELKQQQQRNMDHQKRALAEPPVAMPPTSEADEKVVQELKTTVDGLSSRIRKVESQMTGMSADLLHQAQVSLNDDQRRIRSEFDEKMRNVEEQQSGQWFKTTQDLTKLTATVSRVAAELEAMRQATSVTAMERETADTERFTKSSQAQRALDQRVQQLAAQHTALKDEVTSQVTPKLSSMVALEEQVAQSTADLDKLRSQVERLRQQVSAQGSQPAPATSGSTSTRGAFDEAATEQVLTAAIDRSAQRLQTWVKQQLQDSDTKGEATIDTIRSWIKERIRESSQQLQENQADMVRSHTSPALQVQESRIRSWVQERLDDSWREVIEGRHATLSNLATNWIVTLVHRHETQPQRDELTQMSAIIGALKLQVDALTTECQQRQSTLTSSNTSRAVAGHGATAGENELSIRASVSSLEGLCRNFESRIGPIGSELVSLAARVGDLEASSGEVRDSLRDTVYIVKQVSTVVVDLESRLETLDERYYGFEAEQSRATVAIGHQLEYIAHSLGVSEVLGPEDPAGRRSGSSARWREEQTTFTNSLHRGSGVRAPRLDHSAIPVAAVTDDSTDGLGNQGLDDFADEAGEDEPPSVEESQSKDN